MSVTLTPTIVAAGAGASRLSATSWLPFLQETIDTFGIDTPQRVAAFLAQIGHESMYLTRTREIWGPTPAQSRYEGRKDLGNVNPGDGSRYRGRGLIQTTGRANYAETYKYLLRFFRDTPNFEKNPTTLEQPYWAAVSAGAYWAKNNLNRFADKGQFVDLTRRINGGTNGLADRQRLWNSGKLALGID